MERLESASRVAETIANSCQPAPSQLGPSTAAESINPPPGDGTHSLMRFFFLIRKSASRTAQSTIRTELVGPVPTETCTYVKNWSGLTVWPKYRAEKSCMMRSTEFVLSN